MTRSDTPGKRLQPIDGWTVCFRTVFRSVTLSCVAALLLFGRVAVAQLAGQLAAPTNGPVGGIVYGTVSSWTGAPAAYARVAAAGSPDTTIADSLGSYILTRLPAGASTLNISRKGLEPLTVRVLVPNAGRIRVDVILSRSVAQVQPESLPPVLVRSALVAADGIPAPHLPLVPGVWEWRGSVADAPESSGEADVFRLLVSNPDAMMHPDGFGGTLVEATSGATPERIFVDGIPMWNPLHGASSLAAIDPDVVSALRVSGGSASARLGDALFETVDVQTRGPAANRPVWGVGLGPIAARGWWNAPFSTQAATGQLLVAVRRSASGIFPDGNDANPVVDHWDDGIAVLSLRHKSTAIQIVALRSGDNLAADVDDAMVGARTDTAAGASRDAFLHVPWRSSTIGAMLTEQISPTHTLVTRMWNAQFATTANFSLASGHAGLSSYAGDIGVASDLNLGTFTLGASMENTRTAYQSPDPFSRELRGNPTIVAAYAERRWGDLSDRWSAVSGIRATQSSGSAPSLEPRLSIRVDLPRGIVATGGYAVTSQFVQSVRDVTLAGGALVPVSFPVAAGSAGVPVASARSITAGLSRDFGSAANLSVDAYDRKFNGRITPGSGAFDIMSGRTVGLGSSLQASSKTVTARVTYGLQRTMLSEPVPYLPSRQLAQSGTAVVEWRASRMTRLRLLSSVGTAYPSATDVSDDGMAVTGTTFRSDIAGAETRSLSTERLSTDHLPVYMRTDLGVIRDLRATEMGEFAMTLTLANVFNRSNVTAFLPGEGRAGERVIALAPRSLLAGISWHR